MNGRIFSVRTLAIVVVLVAVLVYYFVFDPVGNRFAPQCLFHKLTGLQCAGCGSQRLVHALLHGDVVAAFRANALAFISIPFLLLMVYADARRRRYPVLHRKLYSTTTIVIACSAIVVWSVVRNIVNM